MRAQKGAKAKEQRVLRPSFSPWLGLLLLILAFVLGATASYLRTTVTPDRCQLAGSRVQLDGCTPAAHDLARVDLRAASLRGANLDGADLSAHDLRGAHLEGASLRGANLSATQLQGANFRGADVAGAVFRSACTSGADFRLSNIAQADLSGANLLTASVPPEMSNVPSSPVSCDE